MFSSQKKPLLEQLEEKTNRYIVALAYAQNSLKMKEHEKAAVFTVFGDISTDIEASMGQLKRSGINMFNRGEVEEYLKSSIPVIMAEIDGEVRKINRTVKYDDATAMPVQAAIDTLTKKEADRPFIPADRINGMYSFRTLFEPDGERKKADAEKTAEEESGRFDRAMEEIRLKAFLETLRGTSNRNPEYFFKANSLITRRMTDEVVPYGEAFVPSDGPGFAASGPDSISVTYRSGGTTIEYTVIMRTEGDSFAVTVTGYVNRDGARAEFSVAEKYPAKIRETVINSFGLGRLMAKYEESVREFRNARKGGTVDEKSSKKILDDFFSA